jgi:competence protein ComEC
MLKLAPCLAMGWILGTACQLQQESIWQPQTVWLAAIVGLALSVSGLGLLKRRSTQQSGLSHGAQLLRGGAYACLLLASCAFALSFVNARCIAQDHRRLVRDIEGQDLKLTGVVASLPVQSAMGVRFKFEVDTAIDAVKQVPIQIPASVDLSWYDRDGGGLGDAKAWVELKPGDTWEFKVRFKAPHGLRNPGGFDEELWLWEQGTMATGTVRSGQREATPQKIRSSWRYPVAQARQIVRSQIAQHLAPVDGPLHFHAGVIAALVMGDQGAISAADWDLFRATGVAHLMSISGLHITLFAWLVSKVVGHLWRRSAKLGSALCLRWPAPHVSAVGGAVVATFYALFAGWGLPAQRTILMMWVIVLTRLLGLNWPRTWIWGLAFILVVLWDPWALMQAGFWLSFVAVGALMLGNPLHLPDCTKMRTIDPELVQKNKLMLLRINMGKPLWLGFVGLAREQWVVMLALTPLSVLFFGQVSIVGVLANFVAIPWVTWVTTPLAMLGLFYSPCWQMALITLKPLMAMLNLMAAWPGGVWVLPVPPLSVAIAAVFGGLVCLQTWPWTFKSWGILCMAPAFLWQVARPPVGQFDLWFADVGQGNAVLLRTAHHALLYDAGPQYSESADAGQRVLVPFMSRMGVQLDRLVLSHRDIDHTGGAPAVLKQHPQADLLSSLEEGHPLNKLRTVQACQAGQQWRWDGVQFEILHPTAADYAAMVSPNSLSCVLRVEASQGAYASEGGHQGGNEGDNQGDNQGEAFGRSALLVGDIEAAQELAMRHRGVIRSSDILLVPHHGSKTSSTNAFIDAVKPRWAVVQAGYRNRYGHPALQVLQRYEDLGVTVISTPDCGAAYWQSVQATELTCERESHKRYWHYRKDN